MTATAARELALTPEAIDDTAATALPALLAQLGALQAQLGALQARAAARVVAAANVASDRLAESEWLDAKAAAAYLRVPVSWVRAKARARVLRCHTTGRYVRFRRAELREDFMRLDGASA